MLKIPIAINGDDDTIGVFFWQPGTDISNALARLSPEYREEIKLMLAEKIRKQLIALGLMVNSRSFVADAISDIDSTMDALLQRLAAMATIGD